MPEIIRTVELAPWSTAELLGEDILDILDIDDESSDPGLPERHIAVLIDGYHVRKNLAADGATIATGDELVTWLDDLFRWSLDRFLDDDVCVSVAITAWDADPNEADIDRLERASAGAERLARLRAGMSANIRDARPELARADWHFVDLHVGDDRDRQIGVDPHIERDLLLAYLGSAHVIILVTRDTDYTKVVGAVARHAGNTTVEVISLAPADRDGKGLKAYNAIASHRWSWARGDAAPTLLDP